MAIKIKTGLRDPYSGELEYKQLGFDEFNNELYIGAKDNPDGTPTLPKKVTNPDVARFVSDILYARYAQTSVGQGSDDHDYRFVVLKELKELSEKVGYNYDDILENLTKMVENFGVVIRHNRDLKDFLEGRYPGLEVGTFITPSNVKSILFKYPQLHNGKNSDESGYDEDQKQGLIDYFNNSSTLPLQFPNLEKIKSENGVKVRINGSFISTGFKSNILKTEENNLFIGPRATDVDEIGIINPGPLQEEINIGWQYITDDFLIVLNEEISPIIPLKKITNNEVVIPIIIGPSTIRLRLSELMNSNKIFNIDFNEFIKKNKLKKGSRYSFFIDSDSPSSLNSSNVSIFTGGGSATINFIGLLSSIAAGTYLSSATGSTSTGAFRPIHENLYNQAQVSKEGIIQNGIENKVIFYTNLHNVSFDIVLGDGTNFASRFITGVWTSKLANAATGTGVFNNKKTYNLF
jgi:hypothetical protein